MIGGVDDRDWGALEYYADEAEKAGYDGMYLINVIDFSGMDGDITIRRAYDQWIVFEPKQIKSATGNNGNFDSNNPDITK